MRNYNLFKIAYPCSVHWSEMKGDSRKRFCELCNKSVHNVCRMSRGEVKALLAETEARGEDRFCIYIEPPLFRKVLRFTVACFLTVFVGMNKGAITRKLFGDSSDAGGYMMGTVLDERNFQDFGDIK